MQWAAGICWLLVANLSNQLDPTLVPPSSRRSRSHPLDFVEEVVWVSHSRLRSISIFPSLHFRETAAAAAGPELWRCRFVHPKMNFVGGAQVEFECQFKR